MQFSRSLVPIFLLILTFFLPLASETARAELILNGSFENPSVSTTTNFRPGDSIGQGWIVGGVPGQGVLLAPDSSAPSGVQSLLFGPAPNNFIFQDVPALPSSTDHTVSFYYAPISTGTATVTVDVLRNGNAIRSQLFSDSLSTYALRSLTFRTSEAGTYRLQVTGGTNTPTKLDAVSMTAVPEPASVLLLIVGASVFAVSKRRGRKCQLTRF